MDSGGRIGYSPVMETTTTYVSADWLPTTLEVTPGLIEWDGPTRPLAVAEVLDADCMRCCADLDEILGDFRADQEFQPTHVRGEFSWSCPVVCSCGQEVELTCCSLGGE